MSTTQPDHSAQPEAATSAAALTRLASLLNEIEGLVTTLEGQPLALLALLRRLEQLHRQIQDGEFRASLPAERNQLFRLLQEIESSGGWPYIPRLQLRTFLERMQQQPAGGPDSAPDSRGDQHLAA